MCMFYVKNIIFYKDWTSLDLGPVWGPGTDPLEY